MRESQPNVLLISTDHWPAALLGTAGHPAIQTPTLDQLARSGIRFTNCYAECPVCIPARRTLMTGTSPRIHGDRVFKENLSMPELPTMAQTFREAGYQAIAVGKLHVYPQRSRIGFDDVILDEEGRTQYGVTDDYETYLGETGYAGQHFLHGMGNNEYTARAWHLPEETHVTNWATRMMASSIKRRDPTRPGFWFLSYRHPHPPLVPLATYLNLYHEIELDEPFVGNWAHSATLPFPLQAKTAKVESNNTVQTKMARRAFYALCTHIDHSIRVIIGTLREEGLLDNTIICFTSDHGDMLGNHMMWAKRIFYQWSTNIPMILLGRAGDDRVPSNRVDHRLVGWQDVMPTLLDLAGIKIPDTVEGISMLGGEKRDFIYGEVGEDDHACRMIREGRFKLIYYPIGNHLQLFDLQTDPNELNDLASTTKHSEILTELTRRLVTQLYGDDKSWVHDGKLIGKPDKIFQPSPNRDLTSQRGHHFPSPPKTDISQIRWH